MCQFLLFTFFPARGIDFFLEGPFHGQKAPSKLLNDAFDAYLTLVNQAVGWVWLGPTQTPLPVSKNSFLWQR
jgi:hypothetical protein